MVYNVGNLVGPGTVNQWAQNPRHMASSCVHADDSQTTSIILHPPEIIHYFISQMADHQSFFFDMYGGGLMTTSMLKSLQEDADFHPPAPVCSHKSDNL